MITTQVNSRFDLTDNHCSTVSNSLIANLKGLNVKSLLSDCSFLIQDIFYEHSLFFAINNQAISHQLQQYKDLSWTQKIKIGVIKGIEGLIVGIITVSILIFALNGMPSGRVAKRSSPSMLEGLAAAVIEEVLFRGVLHHCLAGTQKIITCVTPQYLQNNRVFKWLTSPSARIISINSMFAFVHLRNGGGYLDDKGSLIQAMRIMLQPSLGILYETTGNIIAPIACHMTNNFLPILIGNFYK